MAAFHDVTQLWDFSQPADLSHLPEDDFIALLHKQYPTNFNQHSNPLNTQPSPSHDVINPQIIAGPTPSSENSSPSPPHSYQEEIAGGVTSDDSHDPAPKRKASDGGLEEGGPNQKAQHVLNGNKKGSIIATSVTSRRKSTGSGPLSTKDESRLLKRKEQNRAAQRAFRERKEKHVKDLEDKVAALEARNEQAVSENENLRDLLTRLQTENLTLKQQHQQQAPFTFSMPKNAAGVLDVQNRTSASFVDSSVFSPSPADSQTPTVLSSPTSSSLPSKYSNPLDWSSLASFDPSILNVLDESPQTTATSGAMSMDFGFGTSSDELPDFPLTTIASNPAFFSLASTFDSVTPPHQTDLTSSSTNSNPYNFDFGSLTTWPASNQSIQDASFNELYNSFMPASHTSDYNTTFLTSSPELASISQRVDPTSSSSSSASSASSPSDTLQTPVSEVEASVKSDCPKSRGECQKLIQDSGPSPFAPSQTNQGALTAVLKKTLDTNATPIISCSGAKFPKTQQSDQNIEVLAAWRDITSHPKFKDVDVNDLCAEFTAKARCDGTKVVLEPQGIHHILETFSRK